MACNIRLRITEDKPIVTRVTEQIVQGGFTPEGTLGITENGTYNVRKYAQAAVDVPNSYTAADEGKVVDGGALVGQSARTVTENGDYDTTLNNAVSVNVPNPSAGELAISKNGTYDVTEYASAAVNVESGEWTRPAEWPDLDLLPHDAYGMYMTYDNTLPPTRVRVCASPAYSVERVQIESDGTVTVLDSVDGTAGQVVDFYIPVDAGDYPCYRVIGRNGANITQFGLDGNGTAQPYYYTQRTVERWFNLPYCTSTYNYGYRGWENRLTQQDTYVNTSGSLNQFSYQNMVSLRSLRLLNDAKIRVTNLANNRVLRKYPFDNMLFSGNFNLSNNYFLTEADMTAKNMTGRAATYMMFAQCTNLKSVKLPTGSYESVTNTGQMFQNCSLLEGPVILPETLTCSIGNAAFSDCYNLREVVILAETMLPLSNVNAFNCIELTTTVYVREALLESYRAATNWVTLYNKNNDFFKPIEGSKFEYLLEG